MRRLAIPITAALLLSACTQEAGNVNARLSALESECEPLRQSSAALQARVDNLAAANDSVRTAYRDRINLLHEALSDFLDQFDSKLYYGEDPDFRWAASHAIKLLDTRELE